MSRKINFPFFFRLVFLAIGLASTASTAVGQAASDESVREAERARFAAMTAADTAALRAELHPDLLYIHSNGLEESADDLVASVAAGDIVYQSFEPLRPPRVQTFGKTALVDGAVRVGGLYQGNPFAVDLRYTSVYQKVRGRWLLVRWQSLKVEG